MAKPAETKQDEFGEARVVSEQATRVILQRLKEAQAYRDNPLKLSVIKSAVDEFISSAETHLRERADANADPNDRAIEIMYCDPIPHRPAFGRNEGEICTQLRGL